MQRHGWTLLFHNCLVDQLQHLHKFASDPASYLGNANVKLFNALSHLLLEVVPQNPGSDDYRQGNTLGSAHRHWRRAKIGRRFRVFFRYDTRAKTIVFAWVNDEQTLRATGSKSDPNAVFKRMLDRGNPPDDWESLVAASRDEWS